MVKNLLLGLALFLSLGWLGFLVWLVNLMFDHV